jgi:2-aminoadipate transaminase
VLSPEECLLRPIVRDSHESPIRAMLALASEPDMISLAGGHPDPALLPRDWLVEAAQTVLGQLDRRALQYGGTAGVLALREVVGSVLATRAIAAAADEILITSGSQQGISLLAQVLIEPGDSIAMAQYNYPAALQAFRFSGARVHALDDDLAGLGELARSAEGRRLKAVYLVPSFANPTGHTLSVEARLRLLEEAARARICVIEDDPYGELWFERPPPLSLCALNCVRGIGAQVVYLTSFSKTVLPALRLGALFAPPAIRRGVTLAKQACDVHSGSLEQLFLCQMLRSGRFDSHLQALRAAYRSKAEALAQGLRTMTAGILEFSPPAGGMFVWARFVAAMRELACIDWFAFGRAHRVLALPDQAFATLAETGSHIRLSFANPPVAAIHDGVQRLALGLVAEMSSRRSGRTATAGKV